MCDSAIEAQIKRTGGLNHVSHEPYISRPATEDHFFFSSFFLFVEVFIPFPDTNVVIAGRNDTHTTTVSNQAASSSYFTE